MLSGKRRSGRGRWAARARRVPNAALLGQQTVPLLSLGASPTHPRRPAAPAHGRGHAHCRAASPASCARRGGHRTPPPGGRCRRRRAHTPYLGPRRPAAATARLDGPPRDTHALPTHHPNIRQVDQAEVKAIKHITTARYKAEQFDDGLAGGRFREGDVWGWLMVVVGEQQGGAGGGRGRHQPQRRERPGLTTKTGRRVGMVRRVGNGRLPRCTCWGCFPTGVSTR